MEFEKSSQAKYFLFDDHEALMACKQDASEIRSLRRKPERGNHHTAQSTKLAPQSFACGYQRNWDEQRVGRSSIALHVQTIENSCVRSTPLPSMATSDQEILIHFHAHQLQRLIGPNAFFPELRRSASTLSTAIMLFRRFYLSNSIIDFPGRPMAAAAALLATKADCDSSLSIHILSHATVLLSRKTRHGTAGFRQELRSVTVEEIEASERDLLVGVSYRLRCHHPYGAIRILAGEIVGEVIRHPPGSLKLAGHGSDASCESTTCWLKTLHERATAMTQSALVYSDVHFLYPPGKIAFAAITVALEGRVADGTLGPIARNYLRRRFPQKTDEDILAFEHDVVDIIDEIDSCPEIDIAKFYDPAARYDNRNSARQRVAEIHRAFSVAAYFRGMMERPETKELPRVVSPTRSRKRTYEDAYDYNSHSLQISFKAARVTPVPYPQGHR